MLNSSLELEEDGTFVTSSLHSMPNQLRNALDEFREKWQNELKPNKQVKNSHYSENCKEDTAKLSQFNLDQTLIDEKRALEFYTEAVDLEKRGKVYDALIFYRKAVQIDPVIEFKFYEKTIKSQMGQFEIEGRHKSDKKMKIKNVNEDLSTVDLYVRFDNDLNINQYFIKKNNTDIAISTTKHINDLPIEIIFNILRWVISSQLDIKSLESFSAVCKGFYLCARDNKLWKSICLKVWGVNTGSLSNSLYRTWREMYIERQRVHFHGCYISKTTYVRYGETSFQDQFYRPIQLIDYYRYFRFSPDGTVVMWTTTEEPAQAVYKLKNLNQLRPEVLKGHYRFHEDIITIVLKRNIKQNSTLYSKRRGNFCNDLEGSYTYFIELKILNKGKKRFFQLQWNNYSIRQIKNKREITTNFELSSSNYPPLWFSRVTSYHLEAEIPLK